MKNVMERFAKAAYATIEKNEKNMPGEDFEGTMGAFDWTVTALPSKAPQVRLAAPFHLDE